MTIIDKFFNFTHTTGLPSHLCYFFSLICFFNSIISYLINRDAKMFRGNLMSHIRMK